MTDIGQRRDNVRAGRQQDGLPPVVLRPWGIVRHHQLGGPIEVNLSQRELGFALVDTGNLGAQQGDLVVDVLHGVLQRPAPAHGLRFDAAHFGLGHLQVRRRRIDSRLFDRDCDLKRLLVQLDQKVSLAHPVVVVDEDARNLAFDAGGHERDVTVDVGVIGRNGVERRLDPGNAEPKGGGQDHERPLLRAAFFAARRASGFSGGTDPLRREASAGLAPDRRREPKLAPVSLLCSLMADSCHRTHERQPTLASRTRFPLEPRPQARSQTREDSTAVSDAFTGRSIAGAAHRERTLATPQRKSDGRGAAHPCLTSRNRPVSTS